MGAIRQEMRSLAKITSFCGSHKHYVLAMTSFISQFALKSLIFSWCPKCKYSYSKFLFAFVAISKISLHAACTSAVVFSCVIEHVTSSKTDRYKSNQNNVDLQSQHAFPNIQSILVVYSIGVCYGYELCVLCKRQNHHMHAVYTMIAVS